MGRAVDDIHNACADLRRAQALVLASMSQADMVAVVTAWAEGWENVSSQRRRRAEALTEPFPYAMTRVSLDALLESITPEALWAVIDSEDVRDAHGPPLIGHIIAGNTPLLAWVSVLRALLMRSASFVKLPSGDAGEWGRLFLRSFAETSPRAASCVHLAQWPGGATELDAAVCRDVDLLLAYGSQATIQTLGSLCPASVSFHGYDHRVSFGIVTRDASYEDAAQGFARDVLLYDQGGCLSPHTILVEGDWQDAVGFATCLQNALRASTGFYPPPARAPQAAGRVQEARILARMEPDTVIWEDPGLRWTVIAQPAGEFRVSPTHGVVFVQPVADLESLSAVVAPVAGHLQGCAVAAATDSRGDEWTGLLATLGVSRLCRPGQLQAPPFSWREDGRDVLRSLLP